MTAAKAAVERTAEECIPNRVDIILNECPGHPASHTIHASTHTSLSQPNTIHFFITDSPRI
jgi:hypothetical protein